MDTGRGSKDNQTHTSEHRDEATYHLNSAELGINLYYRLMGAVKLRV
jgi:hypothetical protein